MTEKDDPIDEIFDKLLSDPKLPESDRPLLDSLRKHCHSMISEGTDPVKVLVALTLEAQRELNKREAISN